MSSEARRLHPAAMLIAAQRVVRRWVGAAVIPGIVFLSSRGFGPSTISLVLFGFAALAVLAGVWGFFSWRATTYGVSDGALHIRSGVINKNERTIPLDHVQSLDTVQGIVQRVFGVFEVRVETAGGGSSEPEASLSALDRAATIVLRREIAVQGDTVPHEDAPERPREDVIRRITPRELLIAGATSGQIGVALSLVAVASQLFDDVLPRSLEQRLFETFAPRSLQAVIVVIVVFAVFAWMLAIAGTVLAHAGFVISREGDFLHIRRGLLERREATIPLSRIQAVQVREGLLRQPFGLAMLRVESAGYGEHAGVSEVLFPMLPRGEVDGFLRDAAPLFAAPLEGLRRPPVRARRRYAVRGTLPFVTLAVPAAYALFPWGLLALALLVPGLLYGLACYRAAGWRVSEDRLVLRFRRLGRTTVVAPRRRLQSRGFSVSPFQRRIGLATFEAAVASGRGGAALRVTDLDDGTAAGLVAALAPPG